MAEQEVQRVFSGVDESADRLEEIISGLKRDKVSALARVDREAVRALHGFTPDISKRQLDALTTAQVLERYIGRLERELRARQIRERDEQEQLEAEQQREADEQRKAENKKRQGKAVRWLNGHMGPTPLEVSDIKAAAAQEGISEVDLREAASVLGLHAGGRAVPGKPSSWSIPVWAREPDVYGPYAGWESLGPRRTGEGSGPGTQIGGGRGFAA